MPTRADIRRQPAFLTCSEILNYNLLLLAVSLFLTQDTYLPATEKNNRYLVVTLDRPYAGDGAPGHSLYFLIIFRCTGDMEGRHRGACTGRRSAHHRRREGRYPRSHPHSDEARFSFSRGTSSCLRPPLNSPTRVGLF